MLGVESARDNSRKFHKKQYRNVPFPLSREKGSEKVLIPVLSAGKFPLAISITPCYLYSVSNPAKAACRLPSNPENSGTKPRRFIQT